jgi:hypothetical protein
MTVNAEYTCDVLESQTFEPGNRQNQIGEDAKWQPDQADEHCGKWLLWTFS